MTTEKELLVMNKLEYLKEIRYRMEEIERTRSSINEELDLVSVEERCLQEYRREMDSLYQEKMTHVEELRQIHSDINMLENVLKQSEEDRNRHVENVKRLHNHLQQMKDGVEKMRLEIGLPRNSQGKDEDAHLIDKLDLETKRIGSATSSYYKGDWTTMESLKPNLESQSSTTSAASNKSSGNSSKPFTDNTNVPTSPMHHHGHGHQASSGAPFSSSSSSLASLMSGLQQQHPDKQSFNRLSSLTGTGPNSLHPGSNHHQSNTGGSFHQDSPSSIIGGGSNATTTSSSVAAAAAAFRQQPPPMKSCLSCHQQIHRNAPICPLCKAKSRSRHPKRRNNPKN